MSSVSAFVLFPILWVVVGVGWAPLLLSARLRALLGRWPAGHLALDYPFWVVVVSSVHVLGFYAGVATVFGGGVEPLRYAAALDALVPLAGWVVVCVVLPWRRDDRVARRARLPLAIGASMLLNYVAESLFTWRIAARSSQGDSR